MPTISRHVEGVGVTVSTVPNIEPVELDDVKTHARVDLSADDGYLLDLLTVARRHVELITSRALITQTIDESFTAFPASSEQGFVLARAPVQSVTSITYYDEDLSTSTVVSSANYQVDTAVSPAVIRLKPGATWPTDTLRRSSGVVVRYVAGYGGSASDVPADILHAIKLLVGQMYTHREPQVTGTIISDVGFTVDALLAPYRIQWF